MGRGEGGEISSDRPMDMIKTRLKVFHDNFSAYLVSTNHQSGLGVVVKRPGWEFESWPKGKKIFILIADWSSIATLDDFLLNK